MVPAQTTVAYFALKVLVYSGCNSFQLQPCILALTYTMQLFPRFCPSASVCYPFLKEVHV